MFCGSVRFHQENYGHPSCQFAKGSDQELVCVIGFAYDVFSPEVRCRLWPVFKLKSVTAVKAKHVSRKEELTNVNGVTVTSLLEHWWKFVTFLQLSRAGYLQSMLLVWLVNVNLFHSFLLFFVETNLIIQCTDAKQRRIFLGICFTGFAHSYRFTVMKS